MESVVCFISLTSLSINLALTMLAFSVREKEERFGGGRYHLLVNVFTNLFESSTRVSQDSYNCLPLVADGLSLLPFPFSEHVQGFVFGR